MILNENQCPRNMLNLALDCPQKAGIYCGTTANDFSRIAMLHL